MLFFLKVLIDEFINIRFLEKIETVVSYQFLSKTFHLDFSSFRYTGLLTIVLPLCIVDRLRCWEAGQRGSQSNHA